MATPGLSLRPNPGLELANAFGVNYSSGHEQIEDPSAAQVRAKLAEWREQTNT